VAEQLAQRDAADRGARQVPVQQVVEREEALVAELQDHGRGQRLGDRAEPVLRLRIRPRLLADAREVQQGPVADHGQRQGRHPTGALRAGGDLVDTSAGFRQQGHGAPLSMEQLDVQLARGNMATP
jgi:hypothetical protein